MKRFLRFSSVIALGAVALCGLAHATPPDVCIQGVLSDSAGNPLSGERAWAVTYFDAPNDGNALSGQFSGTMVISPLGRWSIVLAPAEQVLTAPEIWYELGIDSNPSPDGSVDLEDVFPDRFRVESVMFALKAGNSELLDGVALPDLVLQTQLAEGLATKAALVHDHSTLYSPLGHLHDSRYSLITHMHDGYSPTGHHHDDAYAAINHRVHGVGNTAAATAAVGGGTDNAASGGYSYVGGGFLNVATKEGGFVGGGRENYSNGSFTTIVGGDRNRGQGMYGFVGGGSSNSAGGNYSTVAGGYDNIASQGYTAISGGASNRASSEGATISGGVWNAVMGRGGAIAGGSYNLAQGEHGSIGGGENHYSTGNYTTVAGGGPSDTTNSTTKYTTRNEVWDHYGTVGGGGGNRAGSNDSNHSSAMFATVPGGKDNSAAGAFAFAAGHRAKANHRGAFVWGDHTNANVASERDGQFRVRATGGVRLDVNGAGLYPSGLAVETSGAGAVGLHVRTNSTDANTVLTNTGTGPTLKAYGDGNLDFELYSNGNAWLRGTLAQGSDRHAKANIEPVDTRAVLEKVATLPIATWHYVADENATPHMGPMAQDLYGAFGLGGSETSIATIDADGVSLAAIQGLYEIVKEQQATIEALRQELGALKQTTQ